jgi:hypothetical protein
VNQFLLSIQESRPSAIAAAAQVLIEQRVASGLAAISRTERWRVQFGSCAFSVIAFRLDERRDGDESAPSWERWRTRVSAGGRGVTYGFKAFLPRPLWRHRSLCGLELGRRAHDKAVFVAPSPQANLMCDMADTVRVKQLSARSTCTKMHSINLIELKFTTYNLVTFG